MSYSQLQLEKLFGLYRQQLGTDFKKYRNHVYRVYLNCLLLDTDIANQEKYAYAAFFHDIGIWTDHTIDYLQPSIAQACEYLANNDKKDWVADITLMIYWHHKITRYQGIASAIVEVFRKADWIDVSLGTILFGVSRKALRENRRKFPNAGFHAFLLRKIVINFLAHPLNPLPMFRK